MLFYRGSMVGSGYQWLVAGIDCRAAVVARNGEQLLTSVIDVMDGNAWF